MYFTVIGLLFDIAGALLLFAYGLPSKQKPEHGEFLIDGIDEEELATIRKHNRKVSVLAHTGVILLILGFFLQMAGTLTQRP